jgi:hypothetical protein
MLLGWFDSLSKYVLSGAWECTSSTLGRGTKLKLEDLRNKKK